MTVWGIDPGRMTGAVRFRGDRVTSSCTLEALDALHLVGRLEGVIVAIERVQSYGIAGGDLLRTAELSGALAHAANLRGCEVLSVPRRAVLRALELLGAKGNRDAAVRARLLELYGGRSAAIGCKAQPGPLYGIKGHEWAALAVAWAAREGYGEPWTW